MPIITKNLTINGNDWTIDADGNAERIFDIQSGAILVINDLNLTGGYTLGGGVGGAVRIDGSYLIATNCNFYDNSATNLVGFGGAVGVINVSTFIANNCNFYNNAAGSGGAVCVINISIFIANNCNFYDNRAINSFFSEGGAVSLASSSEFYATGCSFYDNSSDYRGGAVNVIGSTFVASKCSFYNNDASDMGGGMNVHSSFAFVVSNCTFYNNTTLNQGGAINSTLTTSYIFHSTIVGNKVGSSTGNGGGILANGSPLYSYNCIYVGNEVNGVISAANQVFVDGTGTIASGGGSLLSNNLVENTTTRTKTTIFGSSTPVLTSAGYLVPTATARGADPFTTTNLAEIPSSSYPVGTFADDGEIISAHSLDQAGNPRSTACYPSITFGSVESHTSFSLDVEVATSGGGTAIIGISGTATSESDISCGSSRTITATPNNACYQFDGWTNADGSPLTGDSSLNITLSKDTVLTANFTLHSTYTLSVSSNNTTMGTASSPVSSATCGSSVTVTATPNAGYVFRGWQEGGATVYTGSSYTFNIANNRTLTAIFDVGNTKQRIKKINVKKGRLIISPQP